MNTLDDHINSSDLESFDQVGPINERTYNVSRFEGSLTSFSEKNCLDKDIQDRSL